LVAITEKPSKKMSDSACSTAQQLAEPRAGGDKAADGAARQRSSTAYPLTMVGTVTIETRGA
jgi:hypothetical protein